MYNAHQVRAKTRFAVKRREESVEAEEIESGEINLIPYLDIVTNLMLFLLASVSAGIILGQINTMLPDQAPPTQASAAQPQTNPDDQPLKMVVSVTKDNIVLWSVSQREGTLQKPRLTLPRVGLDGAACDGGYMCESGYCDPKSRSCDQNPDPNQARLPVFDYRALNQTLYDIASQHYKGKKRTVETYQAVLMADDTTPYETLISIMGAMRCKMPGVGEPSERCYLPSADDTLAKADNPVDDVNRLYDTTRVDYDPDKDALFNDILFSRGFE
jgi:biopolymer transport protein TolR